MIGRPPSTVASALAGCSHTNIGIAETHMRYTHIVVALNIKTDLEAHIMFLTHNLFKPRGAACQFHKWSASFWVVLD